MSRTLSDSAPTPEGLRGAIIEALQLGRPEDEQAALDMADEAKVEYIDEHLIYDSDILELWDGSTMDEILDRRGGYGRDANDQIIPYDNLMRAITASTFLQLEEDWSDETLDAIDAYIEQALGDPDWGIKMDRDEALAKMSGALDEEG